MTDKEAPPELQQVQIIDVKTLDPYVGAWTDEKAAADEKYFVHVMGQVQGSDGTKESDYTSMILTGTPAELKDFAGKLGLVAAQTESERVREKGLNGRRHKSDMSLGRGIA